MSIEAVRTYLASYGMADRIRELPASSATVALAAQALGTEEARIAKSLAFLVDGKAILIVTAGDRKIDNHLYKLRFGTKAKMLTPEQTLAMIGHPVGGVCPFALPETVTVYCDESLKRFSTVFPACGTTNSAMELSCEELYRVSGAIEWVDLCKPFATPAEGENVSSIS